MDYKELLIISGRRFLRGLLSVIGAYAAQFLLESIPGLIQLLPSIVTSEIQVAILTALLLALDKVLRYRP